MAANPYKSEYDVKFGEANYTLRYDYDALEIVKDEFSKAELENLLDLKPSRLVMLFVLGCKAKHPGLKEEHIKEISPPIVTLATAIDRAMLIAYHGPEQAAKILEMLEKAEQEIAGDQKPKKKPK